MFAGLSSSQFITRRSAVRFTCSDNGTNFVGTRNKFQQGFKEMNDDKIKNFLQENKVDWIDMHFNPPAGSHMGGVGKRQIAIARIILEGLLPTRSLSINDKFLRTLMTEVELVLNSRPLTVDTMNNPNSCTPISPSNLHPMKSSIFMPPP